MKKRKITYSAMHVLMASPDKPTPIEKRTYQLTRMWQGVRALELDPYPKVADWAVVSDAINMMETFLVHGLIQDPDDLITKAMGALADVGNCYKGGKPLRLSGENVQVIRFLLADYADVIEEMPERTLIACHRRTEKRIHDILDGKTQPHDMRLP